MPKTKDRNERNLTLYKGNDDNTDITVLINSIIDKYSRKAESGEHPTYETPEELQKAIMNYWKFVLDANQKGVKLVPDVEGACAFLDISRDVFIKYERQNINGLGETIRNFKTEIASVKKQLALTGRMPSVSFATDFNNNHGYVQKQETVVMTAIEDDIKIPIEDIKKKYADRMAMLEKKDYIDGKFKEIKTEKVR